MLTHDAKLERQIEISVVKEAIKNQNVVESLDCIKVLSKQLNKNTDPSEYTEFAAKICRHSRQIIWAFVSSECCGYKQVVAAQRLLEKSGNRIHPNNSDDPKLVKKFHKAVLHRAALLEKIVGNPTPRKRQIPPKG